MQSASFLFSVQQWSDIVTSVTYFDKILILTNLLTVEVQNRNVIPSVFTCGEASRSMDHFRPPPPPQILEILADRGKRDMCT